nr:serine hydroxymethyltransferase, mitochondrial-like [Ipomoea batatas]
MTPKTREAEDSQMLCYNYRKPGHFKVECPYPIVQKHQDQSKGSGSQSNPRNASNENNGQNSNHYDSNQKSDRVRKVLAVEETIEERIDASSTSSSSFESESSGDEKGLICLYNPHNRRTIPEPSTLSITSRHHLVAVRHYNPSPSIVFPIVRTAVADLQPPHPSPLATSHRGASFISDRRQRVVGVSGGVFTPTDVRQSCQNTGIDGSRVEKVLEFVHIAANKNTVPGDVSAMVPGGIRMVTSTEFFNATVKLALEIKAKTEGTKLKDFVTTMSSDSGFQYEIAKLQSEVEEYAKQFPTIGFEKEMIKYKH